MGRAAGGHAPEALALLEAETAQGRVNDVDHQRLLHALDCVRHDPERLSALLTAIRDFGAAACAHPSGARELPGRGPGHDLLLRQLRLGHAEAVPKNPAEYRGVDVALDPALLGTSLLAVGPAGTGKTARLARPVAEGLCLQALTGTAVAVVLGAATADLGPAEWYDVVVAPGEPGSRYGLDLFGGSRNPEEAAARLADALLPDELAQRGESARLAVQQLVVPFADAHGRVPGVRELGALLRGDAEEWQRLTDAVRAAGQWERHRHQLAQRERLHGQADDPGTLLADRLALLERPAFAGMFNASAGDPEPLPLFALHALDHPLRVRVALPEQSHPEAARILARLVVGQFLHAAAARSDRTLFAGLVVDDASAAVDAQGVRALQRLRGANAGTVLVLRSLTDLPEQLRTPLFGAVGGRMAFPGIAPGTASCSPTPGARTGWTSGTSRAPRHLGRHAAARPARGAGGAGGEKATTESVTTRKVERRRWSSSDLAHTLPAGHAVLSLTGVDGTPVPPLLVDLRG
ncbi:ATP-binding protein [Streptacidiphilus monticola]